MQLKNLYKKILIITGKIFLLLFAALSTAFVNNEFKKKKIKTIQINIISDNQPQMCNVEEIKQYLQQNNIHLDNNSYYETNFYTLEKIINEKNEVKHTIVCFHPDKKLNITITERKPIARWITPTTSYYIDDEWKIMQVNQSYKVPIIIGETYENIQTYKHYPICKILSAESLSSVSILDDIYIAINVILSDTLLSNFIDYLYIDKYQQITLYPIIGKFDIETGNSKYFKEKMNKLKLFIKYGLNKNNAWNKYSHINLKYQNIIYCTKK